MVSDHHHASAFTAPAEVLPLPLMNTPSVRAHTMAPLVRLTHLGIIPSLLETLHDGHGVLARRRAAGSAVIRTFESAEDRVLLLARMAFRGHR